ncbi:hypothetical protein SJAV_00770 [Sulfurisphaera javensis]|uniref:Uncharacterized protein n=1 Tax=Sulfurisphaera javensis TaxID=2049879 RepID=A0AAT9GN45_9CREN
MNHYDKPEVKQEIFEFSKNRWVAIYGKTFVRYDITKRPLKINKPDDVARLAKIYNARTFYATAATYRDLDKLEIEKYTPFFDIDTKIDKWEYAIKAAEIIISFLDKEKVTKSVYLLWSGEGVHVRINENALPKSEDPVRISHAIVKYVLRRVKDQIEKLSEESGGVLKIDDLIDDKRVFTSPLSLHKELNYVAVCFSPNKLHEFNLDWANPDSYKHESVWKNFEENEAEDLAIKALAEYTEPSHIGVKAEKEEKIEGKIGRFQVMGLLQAVRYYLLYGDLNKAKSFGLNRAIFYAWAKFYGKNYTPKHGLKVPREVIESNKELKDIGGEQVYVDRETGYFIIGDKPQTPEDYDKEIARKIDPIIPYDKAWDAAVKYVSSFSKDVLMNQRKFYEQVYLPVRDQFIEKVIKGKRSGLDAFFG